MATSFGGRKGLKDLKKGTRRELKRQKGRERGTTRKEKKNNTMGRPGM